MLILAKQYGLCYKVKDVARAADLSLIPHEAKLLS